MQKTFENYLKQEDSNLRAFVAMLDDQAKKIEELEKKLEDTARVLNDTIEEVRELNQDQS